MSTMDLMDSFDGFIMKEAYDWALLEQRRNNILSSPICLDFEADELDYDPNKFTASVFYNKSTKEALLRREWVCENTVQYNVLMNYDEIKVKAPVSLKTMIENGLNLSQKARPTLLN